MLATITTTVRSPAAPSSPAPLPSPDEVLALGRTAGSLISALALALRFYEDDPSDERRRAVEVCSGAAIEAVVELGTAYDRAGGEVVGSRRVSRIARQLRFPQHASLSAMATTLRGVADRLGSAS